MLTAVPEEIISTAHRMVISYGDHAVEIARERAAEIVPAAHIRDRDLALMVLTEVERLARGGSFRRS
ncbi:hypothetical protein [Paramagnetospirillum marisnigri]|nr:hypothetical protein [Paramagnetospirillum marisnigri]